MSKKQALPIISQSKFNRRTPQLLILVTFLFTFVTVRIVTHLQKAGILPNQSGMLHIHHMVPGILLLLLSGYIGISYWHHDTLRKVNAVLFGIGAALTVDEFALWLFLQDVYWARQGRDSVDVVIIIAILFSIGAVLSEINGNRGIKGILQKK